MSVAKLCEEVSWRTEDRGRKSVDRRQKKEDRGQELGVNDRSQKTEESGRKTRDREPKSIDDIKRKLSIGRWKTEIVR